MPTIQYSEDKSLYYIIEEGTRPRLWLGTQKISGPLPPEKQDPGFLEPHWVEIETFDSPKRVYHRKALPFVRWNVRSGETSEISENSDEYKDYMLTLDTP